MIYENTTLPDQRGTLFIADDHELLRAGVRAVFADVSWVDIVGEAPSAAETFSFVESCLPDLVMLDPCLSDGGGVDCIKRIRSLAEHVKIIIFTEQDSEDLIYECLDAGVKGYLMKKISSQELLAGVQAVLEGKTYLSSSILGNVTQRFVEGYRSSDPVLLIKSLTKREREVFELVGQEYKNREIAEQLFISIKTVEKHRSNVMRKLKLRRAVEVRRLWKDWVATT
jgi:DNA-binding NarL/FixJ family response regulator